MKTRMLLSTVLIAVAGVVASADNATAQGVHFGVGALHIDVGNPHYSSGWYGGSHYRGRGYYSGRHNSYYGGHRGHGHGGHYWHDTSHYDYHPGGYVRHRNHYHYIPGHWDFHETGHWHHDHD
jgi:hypothetical protein